MRNISILRGINVGGHKKILMADLKQIAVKCGAKNPQTYIQSGNLIFDYNGKLKDFSTALSEAIKKEYGFDVPVITISSSELAIAAAKNPFASSSSIEQLHLTFLSENVNSNDLPADHPIFQVESKDDSFSVYEKFVFVKCLGPYHKTKLSNQFFEKQLKVTATTRNWKTTTKLLELLMAD